MNGAYFSTAIAAAAVVVLGFIGTLVAWIYRRGRAEGNLEKSMQDNTKATESLTSVVGGLRDSLDAGFREVHDRIDNHDVRLAIAETDIGHLKDATRASAIVAHGGGNATP